MRLLLLLCLLFLIGLFLRLPTLELPLDGEGARLATRADVLVGGLAEPGDWEGVSSRLLAWVAAPLVRVLPTPTVALRVVSLVLLACWAPLLVLLGLRLGARRGAALGAGLLTSLHPSLAYGAVASGSAAMGGALLLAALVGLAGSSAGSRRVGALLAALLPLGTAMTAPLGLVLVAFFAWRERSTVWRVLPPLLFVLALVFTPLPSLAEGAPSLGVRLAALAFQWVPLASLVVLLPGLGRSLGRAVRARSEGGGGLAFAVAGGALLVLLATLLLDGPSGFGFTESGLGAALLLVPLVLLAGCAGSTGSRPRSRGWISLGAVAALILSLWIVSAPVQTRLHPRDPLLAGRLAPLGQALRAAADAAGEGGWVSLDAPELAPATAFRLKDFAPWRGFAVSDEPGGSLPLPEEHLKRGKRLVMVSRRETWPAVTTLEGQGIFQTEVLMRFGPWVVVRIERT